MAEPDSAPGSRHLRTAAPAKVNFGLRVVGRRPDGYHELESIFLPLDLADELQLVLHPGSEPRVGLCLEPDAGTAQAAVPGGDRNLAARAARAFLERAGLEVATTIRLIKRIPVAAGLGGGSSDAGAVLRSLAGAFPDALRPEALAQLALGLGADVPFFLDPRPALVTGVGERVQLLADWPELALALINPGVPLSTAEVYRAYDALRPASTPPGADPSLRAQLEGLDVAGAASNRPDALEPLLANDLEPAAVRLCPPVARLRDELRGAGALAVGMSGSGPTVFGVFPGAREARAALAAIAPAAPSWTRVALAAKAG
jgi:4-diphosphocytidyl-2-C-methyl-D-erythritol kinase